MGARRLPRCRAARHPHARCRPRRRRAGLSPDAIVWHEGDAGHLPQPDASYDVVLSSVGVMFAPHHQLAAAELLRVCRPGGTIALASWTPAGFVGQLFATMKPYAPPPPPGSEPGVLWGDEAHVRKLFGDGVDDLDALSARFGHEEGGRFTMEWEYLEVVARRR